MSTLGKRLKEARLSHSPKLTQKQVAKLAGISQTTIADIERGRNDGSKHLAALASAVNCSLDWLASNKGTMRGGPYKENALIQAESSGQTTLTKEQEKILSAVSSLDQESIDAMIKFIKAISKQSVPGSRGREVKHTGFSESNSAAVGKSKTYLKREEKK